MGGDEEAAPVMETVSVTRAFKAAAALLGFTCFLLAIVTSAGTSWSTIGPEADGDPYKTSGLFEECTVTFIPELENQEKLGHENFACEAHGEAVAWRSACQALVIIADIVVFASWIVLTVGICSAVEKTKFTLYKVAITGYLSFVVLFVIVLIVYPTMALSPHAGDVSYALGWVYVLAWVNTVVLFIAALFVIIDKGEELREIEVVEEEEEEGGEE